jgi:lipoate-protein ligase A
MSELFLLHLQNTPIFEQLQIEEALLRADTRDICIINSGSPPAIVMGLSGKPEKLLHFPLIEHHQTPVIKRFSGGGTVYIDEHTLFVTFIINCKKWNLAPFPHTIMEWSEKLYSPVFGPEFRLRENDYVFGEKKFGGNAQYIQKERCLHHTSFLWDFDESKMEMLRLPEKRPQYRSNRAHSDFLCTLKHHYKSKEELLDHLKKHLKTCFEVKTLEFEEALRIRELPHRRSSHFLAKETLKS